MELIKRAEKAEEAISTDSESDGSLHEITVHSEALKQYEAFQHTLTKRQVIKAEWRPILWCLYCFLVCVLWGYEIVVGGIVLSLQTFRRDFGTPFADDYVVDAGWQTAWAAATLSGLILGGLISGVLVNQYGRRLTLFGAYLMSIGGVFLQFFSTTPEEFFGGKFLVCIPLGVFTSVCPSYASELAPLVIRGAITAATNFAIVIGQLIAYGAVREASSFYSDERQYESVILAQFGLIGASLIFLPWFPESPYWLVAHGKYEAARQIVVSLHANDYPVDGKMAEIHDALARMNQNNETQGSMLECFSRKHVRRTIVATSMFFISAASGVNWVVGYMSYFMQLGGMGAKASFDTSTGILGLMVIGNIAGWFFVEYFGLRNTAFYGVVVLSITLYVIGVLACVEIKAAIWAQVALMALWGFVFQATVGSTEWPISAETPTSRLRVPTQSLATVMNGLSSCLWTFSLPYAINPDQGNLGGKIAFIFGSVLVLCAIFVFCFIPETKGRTYIEIDHLWEQNIPAWRFSTTKLETIVVSETSGS